MKRKILTALIAVTLGIPGCNASPGRSVTKKTDRQELLVRLHVQLETVREKARNRSDNKPFEVSNLQDVSLLKDMSKTDIQTALGEPNLCDKPARPAPCINDTDWFYSYYYLPSGWNGGGPELLLEFDKDDKCRVARWVYTQ
jgi:hypothetical protein